MTIRLLAYALPLLLVAGPSLAQTPEAKGLELAKRLDKANEGWKTESSTMEMVLINAHGDKVSRSMRSEVVEGSSAGDKSLIVFELPADVKGTKMLTHGKKTGNDDQWLFMPTLGRVKRITSRGKTGSFMGSEFSFEDLGAREVEKFTYKYLRDETLNGRDCWVSESYPTDKKSGYSKQVSWQDKEYMGALKVDFYDKRGALLKTMEMKGYKRYGSLWRAESIEVSNHQTKKRSILSWRGRKLGADVDTDELDPESLSD